MIPFADSLAPLEFIETGTFIDQLAGGFPKGRISEVWGENNTGKTTVCLQAIKAAQEQGLRCLLIDVEYQITREYLEMLGVSLKKLGIIREKTAEEYLDRTLEAVESGDWDFIVLDSIGSLSSRTEQEKSSGEKTIGMQASLMSVFVRKLAPLVSWKNIAFVGINHSRVDIMTGKLTVMGGKGWSEKKKLAIRLREKTGAVLKSGENVVGKVIIATVYKTGVSATERKEVEVHLINGQGFSKSESLIEEALRKGSLTKVGNTFYFGAEKIGTMSKVREWVKENAEALTPAD